MNLQLTFDDGPIDDDIKSGPYSALKKILKVVESKGIKVAFFDLGKEIKVSHAALITVHKSGHIIGNHSWSHLESENPHRTTKDFTDDEIIREFIDTHIEIRKAMGIEEFTTKIAGIETLDNKFKESRYTCVHEFPELTAVCPVTILPDFYNMKLIYNKHKMIIIQN
jgi:hypothetical protein